MALNLLDAVKGYFNSDMIGKVTSYLGESDTTIKKNLDAIIPTSLLGIVDKAQSSPESVVNLAKEAYGSGFLNQLGDSFKPGGAGIPSFGPSMLSGLFGDKFGGIANLISGFTGAKGSTVSALFGSIAPLALGLLGKHAADTNAPPGSISSLLSSQKSSILSALPAGLNLSKFMGGSGLRAATVAPGVKQKKSSTWIWLLVALVALLLFWLLKTCNKPAVETVVPAGDTAVQKTPDTTIAAAPAGRQKVKLKLPNGVELDAWPGGIEDSLIAFLSNPATKAGKDVWFDFNDLNFKFGTAEVLPESQYQLDNIVKILKAFPKAKVKVGGYTDKVGDDAMNKKLSGERAAAVASALKAAGVGGQVTGAEGYGSQFAKYPASAQEEDRVKDRRVSLSVREK